MALQFSDNFQVNAPKDPNNKKGVWENGAWRAFTSVAEAQIKVEFGARYLGLTQLILTTGIPTEYWYKNGIQDSDLIIKSDGVTVPDATTTVKGKIMLSGDLGGNADSPTVPGLLTKANKTGEIGYIWNGIGLQPDANFNISGDAKANNLYATNLVDTSSLYITGTTTSSGTPYVLTADITTGAVMKAPFITFAPFQGGSGYIWNGSSPQSANLNITGNGTFGGTLYGATIRTNNDIGNTNNIDQSSIRFATTGTLIQRQVADNNTALNVINAAGSTGDIQHWTNGTTTRMRLTSAGNLILNTVPTAGVGTPDLLARNNTTGVVERVVSSVFAPANGGAGYIQNTTSQQASSSFSISGTGRAPIIITDQLYGAIGQAQGGLSFSGGVTLSRNATGNTAAFIVNQINAGSTGDIQRWYSQGSEKARIDVTGNFILTAPPADSVATYDMLTRNVATGAIEKVSSSIFPTITGDNEFTGDNTFILGGNSITINPMYLRAQNASNDFVDITSQNVVFNRDGFHTSLAPESTLTYDVIVRIPSVEGTTSVLSNTVTAPASSTAAGRKGEVRVVGTDRYECIANNTWIKHTVVTTF